MTGSIRLVAGALLAAVGCYLLHRACHGLLSPAFEALPIPWAQVAGFLALSAAALWGARVLWERWLLAFGATAIVIGTFTYRIYVGVNTTRELYPWVSEIWVHRELASRKVLMIAFLALGVGTYYYDYWRRYRGQNRNE